MLFKIAPEEGGHTDWDAMQWKQKNLLRRAMIIVRVSQIMHHEASGSDKH
jgi:hypothetical protein